MELNYKKVPDIITNKDMELPFNLWDGMGLISPEMSKIWSEEVGYDGIAESFIVRAPYIKGLVATFDFHKFSDEIAHSKTIKDIYGIEHNSDNIDIILTISLLFSISSILLIISNILLSIFFSCNASSIFKYTSKSI